MLHKPQIALCTMIFLFCCSLSTDAQNKPTFQTDVERLATTLVEAKTDEERNELLAAHKELVNSELLQVLIGEATRLFRQGQYPKALSTYNLVKTISEQIGDKAGIARAFNGLGIVNYLQGNYEQALDFYKKSLAISEELNDKAGIERTVGNLGVLLEGLGDYEQALKYYEKSMTLSEERNDKAGIANSAGNIANIYRFQGDHKKALEFFQKSLALSEESKDYLVMANALNNIGSLFKSQSDYEQALTHYQRCLALYEELKDKAGLSAALNNIGDIHNLKGDFEKALEFFQRSLSISEELNDKRSISISLNNIGLIHHTTGNYKLALEYILKAFDIKETLKDKVGIATLFNNMGNIFFSQNNYAKALEFFQKSLALGEDLKDKNGIANRLNNIGALYYSQRNYGQALLHFQKSLIIYQELNYKGRVADLLNAIGNIYNSQGNYKLSLEYYQKSLEQCEKLNDKLGVCYALNNIGNMHIRQESYQQALEYYIKSLSISEELKKRDTIAVTLNSIAGIYNIKGNYQQSLEFINRASNLSKQIGDLEQLRIARSKAGAAYIALKQPAQAFQSIEEAISTTELLRSQIAGGEQAQQLFFENKIDSYYLMVDFLISQNNLIEALSYAERAKARVLLDVLLSGKINISKAMTTQEQDQERTFKNRLVSLNTQLYREKQRDKSDASRIADLEKELDKARLDFEAFQTSLYAAHPELKTQRAEVKPVTLDEASSLLPNPQSALLEFVVADEKTFLFVITQTPKPAKVGALRRVSKQSVPSSPILKVYTIDVKQKDLAERARSFREMLAKKELGFRKPGRELYDLLIKPAQEQLKGITTLVIVPEGVLWELPFQALQTPQNRYLLEDSTLFYSPSLTALREMSKPRKQDSNDKATTKTLLAFGNPSLGDESKKPAASVLMGENLEPLPGAEEQVKLLARLYGTKQSKYYIGPEAREQQVKAEAGGYRILQFATHGILNDASPMYSHLVLSQTDEKSDEDGLLEAWEIMQMDLNADLAVLAACETARGRVGAGEGVIGLTWAMFVAGCPTTVVSQWKVEDDATKDLMLEFHRLLKLKYQSAGVRSKMTKAEALRQAALKMLKSGREPHPFYWAGFVMTGSGN